MAQRRGLMGALPSFQENDGAGLVQPVLRPSPYGAGDMSYTPPEIGMQPKGASMATPGGGGQNSQDLLQMLIKMLGGGGNGQTQGY